MKNIEIKNDCVLVNGAKTLTEKIIPCKYSNKRNNNLLDLRKSSLKNEDVKFSNKSNRNIYIIGCNDWFCVLKNNENIDSINGIMKYMSQKSNN